MIQKLKQYLAPNRVAVYFTVVAAITGGLAPVLADLDLTSTAGVLAGVVAIVAVVQKFLAGWQQYESAIYQADLLRIQQGVRAENAAAASAPRKPGINLPR